MLQISRLGSEHQTVLTEHFSDGDVRLVALADLDRNARPAETVLALVGDRLAVITGRIDLVKAGDLRRAPGRVFAEEDFFEAELSDVKRIYLEELISTARLMAETSEGLVCLAVSSFSRRNDLLLFVKYYKKAVAGEDISGDPEDFSPELFCPRCGRRYMYAASKSCPYCESNAGLFRKFGIFVKKYRLQLMTMLGLLLLVSGIGVVTPYFSSAFYYDKVLTPANQFYGTVIMVVLIVAGVSILGIFVNMAAKIITAKMAGFLVYDLKVTIFESMKRLSLDFFTSRQTGGLMTQIKGDAASIHWFFVDGLSYYVVSIAQILVVAVIMFVMQPYLALLCVTVLPLFFWLALKTLRKQHYYHFKRHASSRKFSGRLTDAMGAIRVTKAFAMEEQECEGFEKVTLGLADTARQITIFRNTAPPALHMVMFLSTLLVWGVGGWLTMTGRMTYGFFAAFLSYCGMLNSPLYSLADMMDSFADCANAMRRLFEIYDAEPGVRESDRPVVKEAMEGKVEFRNVCFSYEKNRRIIENVSFKILPGQKIGIVGHSGAGKSTLANLLLRLYDTEEGEILIDDVNVKDLPLDFMRRNISIVSQETYIFEGTIYENIAYACEGASRADVVEATRSAGAHEFIVKLEEGYETKVGAGGHNLSGGEKQRISIARAILKKPRILVLDEATASMDTKTERMIQMSLDSLSEGLTTITIAHRLSTLKNADRIIVIENGRLYEEGTAKELILQDGIYRRLYLLQTAAMKNIIHDPEEQRKAIAEEEKAGENRQKTAAMLATALGE